MAKLKAKALDAHPKSFGLSKIKKAKLSASSAAQIRAKANRMLGE